MGKTLLFSIAIAFCVGRCIVSAKEGSEVDASIPQKETGIDAPMDLDLNKEFRFSESGLEASRADECKCKNGKCMRKCDVDKTAPCVNKKVCICNPEFAEKVEGQCEYCDCGIGANCTFYRNRFRLKICHCPPGYYEEEKYDSYDSRCRAECSDEQPCQNGGSCLRKRCRCQPGTSGDMCEKVNDCSECVNRFEVDCLYDQSAKTSYCSCKNSSLFYDYEESICKPCPCENGDCEYEFSYFNKKTLKCNCHYGYKLFNGYCKKCDCDFRSSPCEFDSDGQRICKCPDGFFERGGRCELCGCTMYSDLETKCEMIDNMKRCFCKEGMQDINGHCEDINECEINDTCHPSSTCFNTAGSFECHCPKGYKGPYGSAIVEPGEECVDINECKESPSACWFYNNVKCVNLPGSYKCECFQGYKPRSYSDEPHQTSCVETQMNWGPALIVIFLTLALLGVSGVMHKYIRNRALQSN